MGHRRVLSVGQCALDSGSIGRLMEQELGATVQRSETAGDAVAKLKAGQYDLVLVNRVFDADGDSGLALIEQIKQDDALQRVPVMLVSNYADAQEQAVALGALHGFGKAALGQPETKDRLLAVLGKK